MQLRNAAAFLPEEGFAVPPHLNLVSGTKCVGCVSAQPMTHPTVPHSASPARKNGPNESGALWPLGRENLHRVRRCVLLREELLVRVVGPNPEPHQSFRPVTLQGTIA